MMKRFIALMSTAMLCIVALSAQSAEAQYYPRTGGPYYAPAPRPYYPPSQPYISPRYVAPNVRNFGNQFYGRQPRSQAQQCCHVWTREEGWKTYSGSCAELRWRATNGAVHQRWGYPY